MSENCINNVLLREQDKEEDDVQNNSGTAEGGWPLQKLEKPLVNGGEQHRNSDLQSSSSNTDKIPQQT